MYTAHFSLLPFRAKLSPELPKGFLYFVMQGLHGDFYLEVCMKIA